MYSLLEKINRLLPNCYRALDLAERGLKRPLKLHEKVGLKYNSHLCLHCSCAENKFKTAMGKLREAEAERKSNS